MTCRCAPALDQLLKEFNARWPNRDKASDGCCGDAAHAARVSDHNPDASGYAHARDFDEDITPGFDLGPAPLMFLTPILLADARSKYVIYERRIYYPGGVSKVYDGVNAHEHHLHLSIKAAATFDTKPWLTILAKPASPKPPPTTKESDVALHVLHPGETVTVPVKAGQEVALATDPYGAAKPDPKAGGVTARVVIGPNWHAPPYAAAGDVVGSTPVCWVPPGKRLVVPTAATDEVVVVTHIGRQDQDLTIAVS